MKCTILRVCFIISFFSTARLSFVLKVHLPVEPLSCQEGGISIPWEITGGPFSVVPCAQAHSHFFQNVSVLPDRDAV